MFPLAVILAVACYTADMAVWRYALPVAVIGLLIAAYHNLLFWGVIPEAIQPCGLGPSCFSAISISSASFPFRCCPSARSVLLLVIRRRHVHE